MSSKPDENLMLVQRWFDPRSCTWPCWGTWQGWGWVLEHLAGGWGVGCKQETSGGRCQHGLAAEGQCSLMLKRSCPWCCLAPWCLWQTWLWSGLDLGPLPCPSLWPFPNSGWSLGSVSHSGSGYAPQDLFLMTNFIAGCFLRIAGALEKAVQMSSACDHFLF